MRISLFSVLVLLPVFISATQLGFMRRDDSTNNNTSITLEQAALNLLTTTIAAAQTFVDDALKMINSNSSIFDILQAAQQTNEESFSPFSQAIAQLNCSFGFLDVMLVDPPATDQNRINSLVYAYNLIYIAADSILSNATALQLTDSDTQLVQNAQTVADKLAVAAAAEGGLDPADASNRIKLANFEVATEVELFAPTCSDSFAPLIVPGVPSSRFNTPLLPGEAGFGNFANLCPNGANDPNCFCQTISSNTSVPILISNPTHCIITVARGLSITIVTKTRVPLSPNPVNRVGQLSNYLVGPFPPFFGDGN